MLVTREQETALWAFSGTHKFIYYSEMEEKKLAKVLKMKEVADLKYSVFVGHGYLQQAGGDEGGDAMMWY